MISPVLGSSLLNTGHELPSALTKMTSNFVPRILNDDSSAFIGPKSWTVFLYRFGGTSVVGRSREISVSEAKMTDALSLFIFFKKNEAITVVAV
jgi:hypothetical protein